MTLTEQVTKNIIRKLIKSEDYRIEIVQIINAEFLQFAIDFFKQIVEAKLRSDNITSHFKYQRKSYRDKSKKVDREVDFYLINGTEKYRCEVKLMGQGNPESADAIFARKTKIFVADKLSEQNKNQSDELGVHWVELHSKNGYMRFRIILQKLNIPHNDFIENIDSALDTIFKNLTP